MMAKLALLGRCALTAQPRTGRHIQFRDCRDEPNIDQGLWPELSLRERQLVQLILAGHPTATISARLGITVGTVKNHRRRIYEKLDITTERELFLQFFQHQTSS